MTSLTGPKGLGVSRLKDERDGMHAVIADDRARHKMTKAVRSVPPCECSDDATMHDVRKTTTIASSNKGSRMCLSHNAHQSAAKFRVAYTTEIS